MTQLIQNDEKEMVVYKKNLKLFNYSALL